MKEKQDTLKYSEVRVERLDIFVTENYPEHSRNLIQNLIKKGQITVNGKAVKPSYSLEENDEIKITWPSVKNTLNIKDLIIFEDKNFFVINKPAGLLVHPQSSAWEENKTVLFASEETLVSAIYANPPANFDKNMPRLGLVHRLDKETSGIMLVAKNERFQSAMTEMFANREVHKTYNAICCGEMPQKEGLIDVPIGREAGGRIKASPVGREALTEFKVKQQKSKFYWVELHPITGRTNQLRVHLNWLGCPVLGDWLYKGATAPRLMLHARKIKFKNPITHRQECFEVKPPKDFLDAWKNLN
ncbi:MAG: RluA family pseudouridine synthase [Elusimicrobiaceae bacterium]|nr:RluA family pseudouridine synthase [Elusimicrobiaceae bacterium]